LVRQQFFDFSSLRSQQQTTNGVMRFAMGAPDLMHRLPALLKAPDVGMCCIDLSNPPQLSEISSICPALLGQMLMNLLRTSYFSLRLPVIIPVLDTYPVESVTTFTWCHSILKQRAILKLRYRPAIKVSVEVFTVTRTSVADLGVHRGSAHS
jgi:hypothetical protein